tara:strand:- start:674 stop:1393 length:720 start_codon:yes stop_codon:yes gene_type:complete
MKIAIVTLGDENVYDWNKISFPNKLKYCNIHGYDFITRDRLLDQRPAGWSKIVLILEYLNKYDYIFWSDTDSLVVDPERKLEDLIDKSKDIIFCMTGVKGSYWTLSSGQFFVKNTDWSRKFLETVYNQTFLVNSGDGSDNKAKTEEDEMKRQNCGCDGCKWFKYDQKGFIHVTNKMDKEEKKRHIGFYEPSDSRYFNSYGENLKEQCFIRHFPGRYKNFDEFRNVSKTALQRLENYVKY